MQLAQKGLTKTTENEYRDEVEMFLIITSCSASKDDSLPIPKGSRIVDPQYYLKDPVLISKLRQKREHIFSDPRANTGTRITYAFDLYVNAGKAYRKLRNSSYQRIKSRLISSNEIEWFFLSGGYGIIHALEKQENIKLHSTQPLPMKRTYR